MSAYPAQPRPIRLPPVRIPYRSPNPSMRGMSPYRTGRGAVPRAAPRPPPYRPGEDEGLQEQIAKQLIDQGYPPDQVQNLMADRMNMQRYLPRPKTTADQALSDMRNEAAMARAQKTLNPPVKTTPFTDPTTGQMYDIQTEDNGRRSMLPQMHDSGAARFQPKVGAFKGTDDEGNQWKEDRGEYGQPINYDVTKGPKAPKEPPVKTETMPNGQKRAYQDRPDPDGSGVTRHYMDMKSDEDNPVFDTTKKMDWVSSDKLVKGSANYDENGNWDESKAKYDMTDAAKGWSRHYDQTERRMKGAIAALQQQHDFLANGQNAATPEAQNQRVQLGAQIGKLRDQLGQLQQSRQGFEDRLEKQGMADTYRNFRTGEQEPDLKSRPNGPLVFDKDYQGGDGGPQEEPPELSSHEDAPAQPPAPASPATAPSNAASAPDAGSNSAPPEDTHRVIAPSGQIKLIPHSLLNDALSAGGKLADDEEGQ